MLEFIWLKALEIKSYISSLLGIDKVVDEGKAVVVAAWVSILGVILNIIIVKRQAKRQRTAEIITKNRIEWMQKLKEYMSEYIVFTSYYETKKIPEDLDSYFDKLNELTSRVRLHLNFIGDADYDILDNMNDLNVALKDFSYCVETKKDSNSDDECPYSKKYIEYFIKNYLGEENEKNKNILLRAIKEEKIDYKNKDDCKNYIDKILKKDKSILEEIFMSIIFEIDNDMKSKVRKIKYSSQLIELLTQIYLKTEWERVKKESVKGNLRTFNFDKKYEKYKMEVKSEIDDLESKIGKKSTCKKSTIYNIINKFIRR